MTRQAAETLRKVSDDVKAQGYRLKVYDAYRPQRAVNHFIRWAEQVGDTRMKTYFYPELDKSVLFDHGYMNCTPKVLCLTFGVHFKVYSLLAGDCFAAMP